jgi:hypothetical protein
MRHQSRFSRYPSITRANKLETTLVLYVLHTEPDDHSVINSTLK